MNKKDLEDLFFDFN